MINDILDFSKIEAGKLELEARAVRPARVRRGGAGARRGASAGQKGSSWPTCSTSRRRPSGSSATSAGCARCSSTCSERGEVHRAGRGRASPSTAPAETPTGRATTRLHFAVRDTGIGIPADRHGPVCSSRSARSTRRPRAATAAPGLGLAICRRLVELMGGRIWVESDGRRGLDVPVHRSTPRAAAASRRRGSADGASRARRQAAPGGRRQRDEPRDPRPPGASRGGCEPRRRPARRPRRSRGSSAATASTSRSSTCRCRRWTGSRWPARSAASGSGTRPAAPAAHLARRPPRSATPDLLSAQLTKPHQAVAAATTRSLTAIARSWPADAELAAPVDGRGRRPSPLRILLAEDNAVNQKVALRDAREAGLPRRRRGERPRGARGARAAALRRRADGRADARDGRPRGHAPDLRALAGRVAAADHRHDGERACWTTARRASRRAWTTT